MRPIPEKITANGLFLCQVQRNDHAVMYRVMGAECGPTVGWEVWQILPRPEKLVFGKTIPTREAVPRNEDFGRFAWSWCSREQAEKCFTELSGTGAN